MVNSAQGRVVDDRLCTRKKRGETSKAAHRSPSLTTRVRDPVHVQDHPSVFVGAARGDENELHAVSGLARSFEVEAGVGFRSLLAKLTSLPIQDALTPFGSVQRRNDL